MTPTKADVRARPWPGLEDVGVSKIATRDDLIAMKKRVRTIRVDEPGLHAKRPLSSWEVVLS